QSCSHTIHCDYMSTLGTAREIRLLDKKKLQPFKLRIFARCDHGSDDFAYVHGLLLQVRQRGARIFLHASGSSVGRKHRVRASERSEEHTSELQSHLNLVCRLLLEKKKNKYLKVYLSI